MVGMTLVTEFVKVEMVVVLSNISGADEVVTVVVVTVLEWGQ
jgi:hypothetical protein